MRWFKKKGKLKETPMDEMKCKCGFPIPPPTRLIRDFPYKRIIRKLEFKCRRCGKVTSYNG
jgi:hypothetical protein